jgi:hypothetical protein
VCAWGGGLAGGYKRRGWWVWPAHSLALVAATGSFAAISALFGSPLAGAFLLMEAAGIGGPMLRPLLLPGLLASGVGSLVFVGLDAWTGEGVFSFALPDLPSFARPDVAQFAWAIGIGLAAAVLITGIRRTAVTLRAPVERRMIVAAPIVGLAIAGLAIGYAQMTGHDVSDVLFSGEIGLTTLASTRGLHGGRPAPAAAVQVPGVRGLPGRLPRRPHVPSHLPRRVGGIALSHLRACPWPPPSPWGWPRPAPRCCSCRSPRSSWRP